MIQICVESFVQRFYTHKTMGISTRENWHQTAAVVVQLLGSEAHVNAVDKKGVKGNVGKGQYHNPHGSKEHVSEVVQRCGRPNVNYAFFDTDDYMPVGFLDPSVNDYDFPLLDPANVTSHAASSQSHLQMAQQAWSVSEANPVRKRSESNAPLPPPSHPPPRPKGSIGTTVRTWERGK